MINVIVKIDLVNSKKFFDERIQSYPDIRKTTLARLIEVTKSIFPYTDKSYPEGSLYSAQGDCLYIVLYKPTVAVRSSIEFLREWFGLAEELPDCRTVIDYGLVERKRVGDRIEIASEVMENISVIEKLYGPGEIGVTNKVVQKTDKTLVQFINRKTTEVTRSRKVISWLVNYENPRLLEDSSLVNALFIASAASSSVREKTFEALIIECILGRIDKPISFNKLNTMIHEKQCPTLDKTTIRDLVKKSNFLELNQDDKIIIEVSKLRKLKKLRETFESVRTATIDNVATQIGSAIGIDKNIVARKLNISDLLERYLCAIFLEIRLMANYLISTNTFLEKLFSLSEYDYILRQGFEKIIEEDIEQFVFLKQEFLNALKCATASGNIYIASIFHNVLMLYYLNRNERYVHEQIRVIRKKKIFLDTNTFYAYMCKSSEYHNLVDFIVKKLSELGVKPKIFDQSITEYNDSLRSVVSWFSRDNIMNYFNENDRPWIVKEFLSNRGAYNNKLNYCIQLHKVPSSQENKGTESTSVKQFLNKKSLSLENLEPFLSSEELGQVYDHIYHAKLVYDKKTKSYQVPGSTESYKSKVLHDANCLKKLQCLGNNPYDLINIFVTCDYRLAKVRKIENNYNCLITIKEFHEFMMPYLLLSDVLTSKPIEIPEFLLASALSIEISNTTNFEQIVAQHLTNRTRVKQDYRILTSLENQDRFEIIKEKHQELQKRGSKETVSDFLIKFAETIEDYKFSIRREVSKSLLRATLVDKNHEIENLLRVS